MPSYKLTYFNARGAAEVSRIIMAYGGIEYEDVRLDKEGWPKFKPATPFGQLPVLEVDGQIICQSTAINRFLAKKVDLHGKSDIDEAKIDMVVGCLEDVLKPLWPIYVEKDEAKKEEKKKAFEDSLEGELKKMENLMEGDYFVGNEISWADIAIVHSLEYPTAMGFQMSMDKVPKLAALKESVMNHPKIAPWIAKRPQTEF